MKGKRIYQSLFKVTIWNNHSTNNIVRVVHLIEVDIVVRIERTILNNLIKIKSL